MDLVLWFYIVSDSINNLYISMETENNLQSVYHLNHSDSLFLIIYNTQVKITVDK